MKKTLSLLLAVLLCCSLFGCGSSDTGQNTADVSQMASSAVRAYRLTMDHEREFTPELGETAAFAAEYLYSYGETESMHLLLLRFDTMNRITVNDCTYTPDSYFVAYDLDADKIYDSEMEYAHIQGMLPNLTEQEEKLLLVLSGFSMYQGNGYLYGEGETLRIFSKRQLDTINAELAEVSAEIAEERAALAEANVAAAKQEIFDAAARFVENPPKGYTASGTLFHGVEYNNPSVRDTPIHCYLMDIRGEFRSKSAYTTRVLVAMDIETGEFYSSLQPEYRNMNIDKPANNIYLILKSYDMDGLNPAAFFFSSEETITPLYADSSIAAPTTPMMTQEELSAKTLELLRSWLAESEDIIAEDVTIRRAAQVRCSAYYGYSVDCVLIQLKGQFRKAKDPAHYPPQEEYTIGCDLKSGEIYTLTEAHAFMDTAPKYYNDMREVTLQGISSYRWYINNDSPCVYLLDEEIVNLLMMNVDAANLQLQK